LGPSDGAQDGGANLAKFRLPQGTRAVVESCPLGAELVTAGSFERPEGLGPAAHGVVCGGGGGEVCGAAFGGAGAGQAQATKAEGEGDLRRQRSLLVGQS
jgi:hypothetical protein